VVGLHGGSCVTPGVRRRIALPTPDNWNRTRGETQESSERLSTGPAGSGGREPCRRTIRSYSIRLAPPLRIQAEPKAPVAYPRTPTGKSPGPELGRGRLGERQGGTGETPSNADARTGVSLKFRSSANPSGRMLFRIRDRPVPAIHVADTCIPNRSRCQEYLPSSVI